MLTQLSIRNIVLIESCEISLGKGLCVLSGETGAGKSILLDALGLALGARSDASLVRSGEAQGSVTAEFDVEGNENVYQLLRELEIDESDTLIVRRTIGSDGKTRCMVNDQPVTVGSLRKLGEAMVEVHGQHDQKTLLDASIHRQLLDDYAGLTGARKKVEDVFELWRTAASALESLKSKLAQAAREQEYLEHMRGELKDLSPEAGEEEKLAGERARMMQGEKLSDILKQAIAELSAGKGAIASLRFAERTLARSPLTSGDDFKDILDHLDKAANAAEEAQFQLEKIGEESQFSPEKLERVEERLFELRDAGRKYNLPVDELPALYEQVCEKLKLIDTQAYSIGELEKNAAAAKASFVEAARKLSEARRKAAAKLSKTVEAELAPLKMEGTRFHVSVEPQDESAWSPWGVDSVRFQCATNVSKSSKDVAYAPLSKIASGGELSRFMLALKVSLLSVHQAGTLIFDEIDTGTGGAVADAIGQRLAMLGEKSQVLVVTHLPQVAARGSQHLVVSKEEKNRKVMTQVRALAARDREEELARMLAGAKITPEARKAAQKLLEEAA